MPKNPASKRQRKPWRSSPAPKLLKVDDVCAILRVGRTSVWKFVKDGRLAKPMTIPGMRGARWTDTDVQTCLDNTIAQYGDASPKRLHAAEVG